MSIRINEFGKEDYQPIYDCTVREYNLYKLVSDIMFDALRASYIDESKITECLHDYITMYHGGVGDPTLIERCLDFCDVFPTLTIKPEFKRLLKEDE